MIFKNVLLLPNRIATASLRTSWYSNGQMSWHTELKNDKRHGECKGWYSNGKPYTCRIYKSDALVRIT